MRRVLFLVGGSLAFWLVVALPFRFFAADRAAGNVTLARSGTAMLLCLVPAALTLAWGSRVLGREPEQQLVMVLGGTGIRLFGVLAAGLVLYSAVPFFHTLSFWVWVLVFYLFTLALEMALLLAGRPASVVAGSPDPATRPTAGLQGQEEETCGRGRWPGQETRPQQGPHESGEQALK